MFTRLLNFSMRTSVPSRCRSRNSTAYRLRYGRPGVAVFELDARVSISGNGTQRVPVTAVIIAHSRRTHLCANTRSLACIPVQYTAPLYRYLKVVHATKSIYVHALPEHHRVVIFQGGVLFLHGVIELGC